jgi:hypothetical protein
MGVLKASLWRLAALTLVAGTALAAAPSAKASLTDGLSIRVGFFRPTSNGMRDLTDFAAWGGGIEYKVGWIPRVFNGEHWSTSLSADIHYSGRKAGILRYIPVSINQIYTFEEQNGHAPYAGFCVTAATFGTTGTVPKQPMVTRLGGGLILGLNLSSKLYLEGRYEWFDRHNVIATPEGFRGYVGLRF